MPSTLPADVARTRKLLIEAARDQFVENGYDGARLKDIADTAGLTTGAVYSQFRNKRELMLAAIFEYEEAELDGIMADAENQGTIVDRLEDSTRKTVAEDEARTRGRILLLEVFVAARRDPVVRERLREYILGQRDVMLQLVGLAKKGQHIAADVDDAGFVDLTFALGLGLVFFDMDIMDMPAESGWADAVHRLFDGIRPR